MKREKLHIICKMSQLSTTIFHPICEQRVWQMAFVYEPAGSLYLVQEQDTVERFNYKTLSTCLDLLISPDLKLN